MPQISKLRVARSLRFCKGRVPAPSLLFWSGTTQVNDDDDDDNNRPYFSATTACLAFASSGRADPDPSHVFSSTA
jgi:hypothetical protein